MLKSAGKLSEKAKQGSQIVLRIVLSMFTLNNARLAASLLTNNNLHLIDFFSWVAVIMKQLNFNHLQYFYAIVKNGSVTKAAEAMHVTPQTVSGQLATFESYIGAPLFERQGKKLLPNPLGQIVLTYADDIFRLGNELSHTLATQDHRPLASLNIGVVNAIAKVMVFDMLNDCFDTSQDFTMEFHEGNLSELLASLSINKLDLIISDQPMPVGISVKAVNHFLGESGITFFASKAQSHQYLDSFPMSLHNAPFLMPGKHSAQYQSLLAWFSEKNISPKIAAEFDDTALLKIFGQAGRGIFCVSSAIEQDVIKYFDVAVVGREQFITDRYYSILPERKVEHPAIKTFLQSAKALFNTP